MSYLETFKKTGAATNRRNARANTYEVLSTLRAENPTASWDRLFHKWRKLIIDDPDYVDAVLQYAWANWTTQYDRDHAKPRRSAPKRTREQIIAERTEIVRTFKEEVKNLVLMDLVMPNGKTLKECKFSELGKFGGWLRIVATKGKPSEIVGEKLTEADLRRIK